MAGCGDILGAAHLANQCGLLVAMSPPTFAIADRYDQGPMEVLCAVFADSGRESHGSNPRRLSSTLTSLWSIDC